ncbi:MAG TPA: methyltransferase domain-containing protein [Acidimicrobiales bacterium]
MGETGTITVLFSDIVGSTDHLVRLGDRDWDEVRRRHFAVLREALTRHDGIEVKNTGDGLMAVFRSVVEAVNCAVAMQQSALQVVVGGAPVGLRIGISTGEASQEQGDWFGTPVVEAARLCALAGTNESWATGVVQALAAQQAKARFVSLAPQLLKGFDRPVDIVGIEPPEGLSHSLFADVDEQAHQAETLAAALDYWGSLPALQLVRDAVVAELSPSAGDVLCDIGCGTGSELLRVAHMVGEEGQAIGVDASAAMIAEAGERAHQMGVALELHTRDGRDTGLASGRCDSVRMERVVQHVGDALGFLAEAQRITRPGGRVVVADTDWGSLMISSGDRDLIRRFKVAMEAGPMAEPWAGRILHGAMLDAGLSEVTSQMFPIEAGAGVTTAFGPMLNRFVDARLATRTEVDALVGAIDTALSRGEPAFTFTMFVTSGRVPG